MARLPEVDWKTYKAPTKRVVSEPVPIVREYEENGVKIKVYEARASYGLVGDRSSNSNAGPSALTSTPKVIYPAF